MTHPPALVGAVGYQVSRLMLSTSGNRPAAALIQRLLDQYKTVQLGMPFQDLAPGDRQSLGALIRAARAIDGIYWKQRSDEGWRLKQTLSGSGKNPAPDSFERLVDMSFGPWDAFDNDRPFWGTAVRPPGGGVYPRDLTREELNAYIERHPYQQAALLSHTTVIRRRGDALIAVPYHDAYNEELAGAAAALLTASTHVTDAKLREFLAARASGLVSGDLAPSDALWVGLDSAIDIVIGPYEVYDDEILGLKMSYEALVMHRHPLSERLEHIESIAPELGRMLPGAVSSRDHRPRVRIGVYDVAFAAGRANMGAKAIAAMLPSDETVRRSVGSRLLLFRNVITAKFEPILLAIARRLLRPADAALVSEDAFLLHTLLHEMAHALSVADDAKGSTPAHEALRERYSTIEECRADLVGLVFFDLLTRRGDLPSSLSQSAAATFVAGLLRALRFGTDNDYARGAAIVLSALRAGGSVAIDVHGCLSIDSDGVHRDAHALAERVQAIVASGDYEGGGELIAKLGSMPTDLAPLLTRLDGIPIDIAFAFDQTLVT